VYIGTAEERAAKNRADDEKQMRMGPGHPRKLPGSLENLPPSLQRLMKSDPSVKAYLFSLQEMENGNQKSDANAAEDSPTEVPDNELEADDSE
jgi:hypothetical protein